MNKKHILITTSEFPPQPGGIGNHAYHLALYLAINDYTVTVIADQRDRENANEKKFDAKLPFTVRRIPLKSMRLLMYLDRVVQTYKAHKRADYVIATGKFSLWNVAFCSLFIKRANMAVIHGTEVNFKSVMLKKSIDFALSRFKTIVAVSAYTAQLVAHLKREIKVIPNGIELSKWQMPTTSLKSLTGSPVLTTVGRVSTRKGQWQVIQLLPELKTMYPNIHYHCIGIPTEADDFLRRAKALDVDAHVTFHGAVEETLLHRYLASTDVFVMLSTESKSGDVEGFGIAILEANALGVPAIGAKGSGVEDAIADGVSGFLVPAQDAIMFKASLSKVLSNQQQFSGQAKTWAIQHDWNSIIKQYLKHLP